LLRWGSFGALTCKGSSTLSAAQTVDMRQQNHTVGGTSDELICRKWNPPRCSCKCAGMLTVSVCSTCNGSISVFVVTAVQSETPAASALLLAIEQLPYVSKSRYNHKQSFACNSQRYNSSNTVCSAFTEQCYQQVLPTLTIKTLHLAHRWIHKTRQSM